MPRPEDISVAVLMGGDSAEREVSLSTGRQIVAALETRGYNVRPLDALDIVKSPEVLAANRPDVVFIALHGPRGEDGSVQGLLELLRIPYTGSGILASALAMDKAMCKQLLAADGIPTPRSKTLTAAGLNDFETDDISLPVVVKPNRQGSSFGLTIVREEAALRSAIEEALKYDTEALVEEYLTGVEITVGVIGNECPQLLPAIEIVPKGEFYDYASKYEEGGSRHIIPPRISDAALKAANHFARRCHQLLGCRGMSRTDFIVSGDTVSVLEVNTIPGMTPTSLLPDAAAAAGITFDALLEKMISYALESH